MSDVEELEDAPTHPRFRERRAEVEVETQRSRTRKLIAGLVVLAIVVLGAASTQSPLLDVDEVRIVGATRSSPEELRELAGVPLGTPLLGLDTAAIEERLMVLPEVVTASASSSWGGVVTLEINERLPVARIDATEGTAVVGADGVVIELVERREVAPPPDATPVPINADPPDPEYEPLPPDIEALPEIAGAMFSTDVGREVPAVLDDALTVATELPADIEQITERIEITVDSLVLTTAGGGRISLGDSRELDEKFEAIRAFLAQVDLSCLDTLNVRAPAVPVIRRSGAC